MAILSTERDEQIDRAGYEAWHNYKSTHNGDTPDHSESFQMGAEWADANPVKSNVPPQTIEQMQTWSGKVRYLIIDNQNRGSVQLELYETTQDEFGGTAFVFALWVSPVFRRKGVAKKLLERAEQIAAEHGHTSVCLEWFAEDTPHAILDWYMRNGYNDKEFSGNGNYVLLEKNLSL